MTPGIYYHIYRYIASKLPVSYHLGGTSATKIRYFLAKRFVKQCGTNVNFEKGASFGSDFIIGDNSGVGINAQISSSVIIGKSVMMGPEVVMLTTGHRHDRIDIPMGAQGGLPLRPIVIQDDVWIGQRAIILPGVVIGHGSIVGAGAVVTKSFPPFSVIGGNPAKLLKNRK